MSSLCAKEPRVGQVTLLVLVQITTAVIAANRGWAALPFYVLGAALVIPAGLPFLLGSSELASLVTIILNLAATGLLIGMAVTGRTANSEQNNSPA